MCCDLIDRSADGQSLTILERIEALEGLFSSCSNFVESSSEELRALEASLKQDLQDFRDLQDYGTCDESHDYEQEREVRKPRQRKTRVGNRSSLLQKRESFARTCQ